MGESSLSIKVGEIVENLNGRDREGFAIVIGILDERFVYIADGDKRKFDLPKKKNVRHLRPTGYISKDIIDGLSENNRVSNAKLRYVLQDYTSNHMNKDEKKGE